MEKLKNWTPLNNRLKGATSWFAIYKIVSKYIEDYNKKNTTLCFRKREGGMASYPIEVFSNPALRATDMKSTFIKIDEKGEIPLPVFLRKMTLNEYNEMVEDEECSDNIPSILSIQTLLNKK